MDATHTRCTLHKLRRNTANKNTTTSGREKRGGANTYGGELPDCKNTTSGRETAVGWNKSCEQQPYCKHATNGRETAVGNELRPRPYRHTTRISLLAFSFNMLEPSSGIDITTTSPLYNTRHKPTSATCLQYPAPYKRCSNSPYVS